MIYEINQIVVEMSKISIEGNIIPNEWYLHLRNEKNKIQTNAALILADIVYWYRPVPRYDINTKQVVGYGKKFKEDLLQLGYRYFREKFGLSDGQIRSALTFLEEKGLIYREFRDIVVGGYQLNNVLHIGICPEKIASISNSNSSDCTLFKINAIPSQSKLDAKSSKEDHLPIPPQPQIVKEKDWSLKFTAEQKQFLAYLLSIKPEVGEPIEKNHATWWIKNYGIEKIKVALQVYCERVEKAKNDSTVPMPQNIGKYVRKALNDNIQPIKEEKQNQAPSSQSSLPYSEISNQGSENFEGGPKKNVNTNTQTSLTSLSVSEINDRSESMTFQNEIQKRKATGNIIKPSSLNSQTTKKDFKKPYKKPDWKESFNSEEQKFLSYLLRLHPEKGDPIEENHATWWIKHFGIEKIKIALQVYWQQVEKAKKDSNVPMPQSIGAYVRGALNKGTQPCRENDCRNKAFADEFKRQYGWSELTITEKYCRVEGSGKEWYYHLPEAVFVNSVKSFFENYCDYSTRAYRQAV
ncbi:hypothetical protein [Candidatus Protochlamydia phocaeensis]|uniref:hypothetical protein n=1 Tax=Candidatus Protochlamydia phocaeensis TaxID=1414722 RepID=UPI000837A94B|nr:hypothetical protein [Candidatus Protochlamydia phocaeensis]